MGLAASQARLLFITARQSDVSAKMQRISNDKMALARDEEEVSATHDRMLNAKIYRLAGSDETASYSNLMGASAAATGTDSPALIKKNNLLCLDSGYASKLEIDKVALSRGSGSGADIKASKEKFISSMTNINEADIKANFSNPSLDKYLEDKGFYKDYGKTKPTTKSTSMSFGALYKKMGTMSDMAGSIDKNGGIDSKSNGNYIENPSLTIDALMNSSEQTVVYCGAGTGRFDTFIKSLKSKCEGANLDSSKVQKVYDNVYAQWSSTKKSGNFLESAPGPKKANEWLGDTAAGAHCVCQACFAGCCKDDRYAFSAKLLVKDFMEALAREYNNGETGGTSFKIEEADPTTGKTPSEWQAEYDRLKSAWESEYPSNLSADQLAKVNYYGKIYDEAQKGWVYDTGVTDEKTFQAGLQNGTYTIDSGNGAECAQNSGKLELVNDPEAATKAKTYFDRETQKIKRKEDKMDTDLQKLQTEYSGLTSDYESVKSILNANIQKSFGYCQTG